MKSDFPLMRMSATACAAATAVFVNSPALAFASEGGGVEAILPKMNEFIPMLVAFLILWFVLAKYGWPAFDGMLEKRATTIRDDLKRAEDARIEAEQTLQEYKKQLDEARSEAARIVSEARSAGEQAKADIAARASQEAAEIEARAHAAIQSEKKAAASELQHAVADLSLAVASKIIEKDLNDEEHRALVRRYIEQAGSIDA